MGSLHTDCPYPPTYANGYTEPETCYSAADSFLNEWMNPIALAAIIIGSIESIAMGITFTIIFKSKDRNSDTAFDY